MWTTKCYSKVKFSVSLDTKEKLNRNFFTKEAINCTFPSLGISLTATNQ